MRKDTKTLHIFFLTIYHNKFYFMLKYLPYPKIFLSKINLKLFLTILHNKNIIYSKKYLTKFYIIIFYALKIFIIFYHNKYFINLYLWSH